MTARCKLDGLDWRQCRSTLCKNAERIKELVGQPLERSWRDQVLYRHDGTLTLVVLPLLSEKPLPMEFEKLIRQGSRTLKSVLRKAKHAVVEASALMAHVNCERAWSRVAEQKGRKVRRAIQEEEGEYAKEDRQKVVRLVRLLETSGQRGCGSVSLHDQPFRTRCEARGFSDRSTDRLLANEAMEI